MGKPFENTAHAHQTSHSEAPAPRTSGFVSHGSEASVKEAIRTANIELDQQSAGHMAVPLSIAVEQRNRALRDLAAERSIWQAKRAEDLAVLESRVQERERTLEQLRQQLRDAEKELVALRDDPKTVIGVGPSSDLQGYNPLGGATSHDSGEHGSLQNALEAAWQEVQDARARIESLEDERDNAVREVDEVRVEVYAKLELAQDEVIELENQLDETRRALEDTRENGETERFRLQSEIDEVRQALHAQIEANVQLRRALATGAPVLDSEPPPASASQRTQSSSPLAQSTRPASIPPVQTSAPNINEIAPESVDSGEPGLGTTQPLPLVTHSAPPSGPPPAFGSPLPPMNVGPAVQMTPAVQMAPALGTHAGPGRPSESSGSNGPALRGVGTSPPGQSEAALAAASDLDAEIDALSRRSRGFGLGRLFQRK